MTFAPITTEFTVPTYIFCSLTPKDMSRMQNEVQLASDSKSQINIQYSSKRFSTTDLWTDIWLAREKRKVSSLSLLGI